MTHAAAEDGAEVIELGGITPVHNLCTDDGCVAADVNLRTQVLAVCGMLAQDGTKLATAIDITLDGTAGDGQLGTLGVTQLQPVNICDGVGAAQHLATAHAARIDITALGMYQPVFGIK